MKSRKVTVLDNEYYQKQMAIKQRDERQRKKSTQVSPFKGLVQAFWFVCRFFVTGDRARNSGQKSA